MNINVHIWETLKSESPEGDILAARLALPEISRKLYAGFDAEGLHHFLIPVNEGDGELNDSNSRGLSVNTRNLKVSGSEPKKYIDITCHDVAGHLIFDVIGGEIAEKIESGQPHDIIRKVLNKWRYFWGHQPADILSYEELIGLTAELWFLYHWLIPKTDISTAVQRWRGPYKSRHDFEWLRKSVEVKATTNVQSRIHVIHGIEQLSPPENGELFLFSLKLREEQGAETTLPKLVAACQDFLKENLDALTDFENALALTGYSPMHNEKYESFHFRVVDEKLFTVNNRFPKITKESFSDGIPAGVIDIEYSINLDGFEDLCVAKSPQDKVDL